MANIRLTLAYDGTRYCGWQVQPNGPTIQAELQRGLQALTGEPCSVLAAGRTDAGVHALGQVANFHTASRIPAENFAAALQSVLPKDILIRDSRQVADDFHATFFARSKRYRYLIKDGAAPWPFLRPCVYHLRSRLDAAAMHAAGQALVGTHDFRCFETDWPNKASSVRTVLEFRVVRCPAWLAWSTDARFLPGRENENLFPPAVGTQEDLVCLDIVADGFLYNMVRSITGTLINVGRGKWPPERVAQVLQAGDRSLAGATAPPQGLYLVQVDYDGDDPAAHNVQH